jgi:hypothetical protein
MPTKDEKLRKELRLKLQEKKLERTCKHGRDMIEKKLKNAKDSSTNRRMLNTIEEQNDKEMFADGCENFITD